MATTIIHECVSMLPNHGKLNGIPLKVPLLIHHHPLLLPREEEEEEGRIASREICMELPTTAILLRRWYSSRLTITPVRTYMSHSTVNLE